MAYLAVVGAAHVNGVAAIHSEIVKEDIFPEFVKVFPNKFQARRGQGCRMALTLLSARQCPNNGQTI